MADIFMSYRRADATAAAVAPLLSARLEQNLHPVSVFFDQERIRAGEAFPERLNTELSGARILLVLIGPDWQEILLERDGEDDWVRTELQTAHAAGKAIFPVLLGDADLIQAELPADLKWLAAAHRPMRVTRDLTEVAYNQLVDDLKQELSEPIADAERPGIFRKPQWDYIVESIRAGTCIPVFGPSLGALATPVENPSALVLEKQSSHGSLVELFGPDLPNVAQVLTVQENDRPYRQLRDWATPGVAESIDHDHPYAVLGDQPLPLYLTVNYDSYLESHIALTRPEVSSHSYSRLSKSFDEVDSDRRFTAESPAVLHLLGTYDGWKSMVLTEDDFLQLFISMVKTVERLFFPEPVTDILVSGTTLLFIGFDLSDFRFRLLLRGLVDAIHLPDLRAFAVVVVASPEGSTPLAADTSEIFARNYLNRQIEGQHPFEAEVHLEDPRDFVSDLRKRLNETSAPS